MPRPAAPPKPKQSSVRKSNGASNKQNGASNDDVARRAYEIYESRGGAHGSDLDHWLEAERELKSSQASDAVPTKSRKPKTPRPGV